MLIVKFSILNEPNMILLGSASVNQWSKEAYSAVRESGFTGSIIISDGFLGPTDFIGQFSQATYPG
jgi:aryl-phospho-beta-D-glucosidase BglC (GH1 family)